MVQTFVHNYDLGKRYNDKNVMICFLAKTIDPGLFNVMLSQKHQISISEINSKHQDIFNAKVDTYFKK